MCNYICARTGRLCTFRPSIGDLCVTHYYKTQGIKQQIRNKDYAYEKMGFSLKRVQNDKQ